MFSISDYPPSRVHVPWWWACPAAVSNAGIPVSSQSCSYQTEYIPAFTSSPKLIINQLKCCLSYLCSASCWGCSGVCSALGSCPPLQPLPKHHSAFSSRAMFTREFQDYSCLTEITLKLQLDLFIPYPFTNMAMVLLSRGGVAALCQWACCKKQTLCVQAQGGFVNNLRRCIFCLLVWVRPERIDAGCVWKELSISDPCNHRNKNSAVFGQLLKFGQLC